MIFAIVFLCLVGISLQDGKERGLYFVNVNEKDEVVLWMMDIDSGKFEMKCNFGGQYGKPYKKYNDHLNLQTGGGDVDPWYNQYEVFLHNDVNNYQSGDLLKCYLKTNKVELVGSYDFSCEHMYSAGAVVQECASTRNSTGTNYILIDQDDKTVEIQAQIPWVAKDIGGNTCFWDISQDNYYCMLFPLETKEYKKNVKYMTDTDLGGSAVHWWVKVVRNQTEVYLIAVLDINTWIAGIRFERGGEVNKAIVKLDFDLSTQDMWNWRMIGIQDKVNSMKSLTHNVYASCEYRSTFYFKAEDKDGKEKLLMVDYKSGNDYIIDTSKFGDLTYVSQMTCL